MTIWFKPYTLEEINQRNAGTMSDFLGIRFIDISDNTLIGDVAVTSKITQPLGIVHGGASCVLAETAGSVAANLCVDQKTHVCVGLDINANHIRSVRSGRITATTSPLHIGRSTHVWQIDIHNDQHQLTCQSRLTMMVIERSTQ